MQIFPWEIVYVKTMAGWGKPYVTLWNMMWWLHAARRVVTIHHACDVIATLRFLFLFPFQFYFFCVFYFSFYSSLIFFSILYFIFNFLVFLLFLLSSLFIFIFLILFSSFSYFVLFFCIFYFNEFFHPKWIFILPRWKNSTSNYFISMNIYFTLVNTLKYFLNTKYELVL
jgi:hypothetical protein